MLLIFLMRADRRRRPADAVEREHQPWRYGSIAAKNGKRKSASSGEIH